MGVENGYLYPLLQYMKAVIRYMIFTGAFDACLKGRTDEYMHYTVQQETVGRKRRDSVVRAWFGVELFKPIEVIAFVLGCNYNIRFSAWGCTGPTTDFTMTGFAAQPFGDRMVSASSYHPVEIKMIHFYDLVLT